MGTIAYRPTKEHEERFDVLAKRTGLPKSFYLDESSGGGFTVRGGGLIVVPMG